MSFQDALKKLKQIEGGYVNDPTDSGGETNYGITVAVARAFGYFGAMKDMPFDTAAKIYKQRYWDIQMLDDINVMSSLIAHEMFDTGVNCGISVSGKFLQRTVNVMNRNGKMYGDIAVDGNVGRMTVAALRALLLARGQDGIKVVLRSLNALQGAYYLELAERREKDEAYVYGWILNRVEI